MLISFFLFEEKGGGGIFSQLILYKKRARNGLVLVARLSQSVQLHVAMYLFNATYYFQLQIALTLF